MTLPISIFFIFTFACFGKISSNLTDKLEARNHNLWFEPQSTRHETYECDSSCSNAYNSEGRERLCPLKCEQGTKYLNFSVTLLNFFSNMPTWSAELWNKTRLHVFLDVYSLAFGALTVNWKIYIENYFLHKSWFCYWIYSD